MKQKKVEARERQQEQQQQRQQQQNRRSSAITAAGSSSSSRSPIRLRQRDSNNIPLQPKLQLPPATTTADNSNSGVNDGIDNALSNMPILPTIKT